VLTLDGFDPKHRHTASQNAAVAAQVRNHVVWGTTDLSSVVP
jgi:hypothetical protein